MENQSPSTYWIGIAGTAMANGALLAKQLGMHVRGSDHNVYSPTRELLQNAGVLYSEGYAAANIREHNGIVVLGNAISRGNAELEEALNRRMEILSLPEFIARYAIRNRQSLVVAGTHGKTTTTALVAHILRSCGIDTGFMVGGVCDNFPNGAEIGNADYFVIEGDEYDTSIFDYRPKFLSYKPSRAIINNIEFDHADIFADLNAVERAFAHLVKIIPQNGTLVANTDNAACVRLLDSARSRVCTFGENHTANYRLLSYKSGAKTNIRFAHRGKEETLLSPLHGKHNALNLLAALALIESEISDLELIQNALHTFAGVRRRLQMHRDDAYCTLIEDFAHHPTAIRLNLQTLRELYPKRRLVVLIEPRSNTMVRNIFQNELGEALAAADVVYIDQIYRPEKYSESERLDIERLANKLTDNSTHVELLPTNDRAAFVCERTRENDVICFMTNGNFKGLVRETLDLLPKA